MAMASATIENHSHFPSRVNLTQLPRHHPAVVERVNALGDNDGIARRLGELGFVAGETVTITAAGPFGAEPLLVQIGNTRFALRRSEAARVQLRVADSGDGP